MRFVQHRHRNRSTRPTPVVLAWLLGLTSLLSGCTLLGTSVGQPARETLTSAPVPLTPAAQSGSQPTVTPIFKVLGLPNTVATSLPSSNVPQPLTTVLTVAPSPTPVPTSAPSPTISPATARFYWPDIVPPGMQLAFDESWPLRAIAPDQQNEPFLVFRSGERWLVVRAPADESEPLPQSAVTETLRIDRVTGMLVRYQPDGLKLVWRRDGRMLQLSGQGVTPEDMSRVAASLRPLDEGALRKRLRAVVVGQSLHLTALWPNYLPPGVKLAPGEMIAQRNEAANGFQEGYWSMFRGEGIQVQVGGGTIAPPPLTGINEQILVGPITGTLTSASRHFLIVIDAGDASATSPAFPGDFDQMLHMPLVQKGRVFISADNLDRTEFDRIVANLERITIPQFDARAREQSSHNLLYFWPSNLPQGHRVDPRTIQVGWDDWLLQGSAPFWKLGLIGPDGDAVTILGGRADNGNLLAIPNEPGAQYTQIHGQRATIVRDGDATRVLWAEGDGVYAIQANTLSVDQLTALGQGLQPVMRDEFVRRTQ